LSEEIIKQENK